MLSMSFERNVLIKMHLQCKLQEVNALFIGISSIAWQLNEFNFF